MPPCHFKRLEGGLIAPHWGSSDDRPVPSTQVPSRVHILLSFMQLLLYGLMIHWGYNLLLRKPDPPKGRKSSLGARAVM